MKQQKTDEHVNEFFIKSKNLNNIYDSDKTIQWCCCFHFTYLCLLHKKSITFIHLFPQKQERVEGKQFTLPICVESLKGTAEDKVSIQLNCGYALHLNPSQQASENLIPQIFLGVTCVAESKNQHKIICFHAIPSTGLLNDKTEESIDSLFFSSSKIHQYIPEKIFTVSLLDLLKQRSTMSSSDTAGPPVIANRIIKWY
jgi:hypothetical protein